MTTPSTASALQVLSPAASRSAVVDRALVWRMRRLATCAVLMALAFVQAPGKIAADTKLDLTASPLSFLGRAVEMWDPAGFGGQVQNQAYGYLFPIGPFYALGHLAGLPPWVVQRLWWGVVLCVAFLAITTLARKLGIGSPTTQLIAGIAFALSPRLMSTLGPVSAEAWPMALAPWVIIPLVDATKGGGVRRPAMASAIAVALMGGVNAALCFSAVVPAATYLITRKPGARMFRLWGWWLGSVVAATVWWVAPLLLLGRYSPPFLDYIETADVTTSHTSLIEAVRGTSHWVAYLGQELGSSWQAGHDLVSQPALVLNSVLVASLGLFGLCLRGMRERGWLVGLLVLGTIAVTFGHSGPASPWFASDLNNLLDTVLAPLRNVHKFDPLIRIPLVLGLAHTAAIAPRMLRKLEGGRFAAAGVLGVIVVVVGAGAAPAFAGRLAPAGSYRDIPAYWHAAADWLSENGQGRTLVVPGSRFAEYAWGRPMDEPLQALTDAPWEVRNAIPLVPAGHIRMLDAVEERLATGTPSQGLAAYLARSGIAHLLVRNDLDPSLPMVPNPALVHQALDGSPGLRVTATFGPDVGQPNIPRIYVDGGVRSASFPAIEIYEVAGVESIATVTDLADSIRVTGGPESLLDLADQGLLPDSATILTAQATGNFTPRRVALTDGLRRRETDFGRSLGNSSSVLTQDEDFDFDRPQHDYTVTDDPAQLTVAAWEGVHDVSVSSALADLNTYGNPMPSAGAAAAFDSTVDTAWLARTSGGRPVEMVVDIGREVAISSIRVSLPASTSADVRNVRVVTPADEIDQTVETNTVTFEPSNAPIDEVRILLYPRTDQPTILGIAELDIPPLNPQQVLVPPPLTISSPAQLASISLNAAPGHVNGCVVAVQVLCSATLPQEGEEDQGIVRRVDISQSRSFELSGTVAARPGEWLSEYLAAESLDLDRVRGSSYLVPDPLGGPLAALDDDPRTGWISGTSDAQPSLTISWRSPQIVDGLDLTWSDDLAASRPTQVQVEAESESIDAEIEPDGRVDLPRLTTSQITVRFIAPLPSYRVDSGADKYEQLPVGVSDLEVVGAGVPADVSLLDSRSKALFGCGDGPVVTIDGRRYETQISTTVDQLARLSAIPFTVCGSSTPTLSSGEHHIELLASQRWRPVWVSLAESDWIDVPDGTRDVAASSWSRSRRVLDLPDRSEEQILTIRENANDGWKAAIDGESLKAVVVDGWMQGYLLPPGPAGSVVLEYEPSQPYRLAIWCGLALLAVLLLAALMPGRSLSLPATPAVRLPGSARLGLTAAAVVLLAGAVGALIGVIAVAVARVTARLKCTAGSLAVGSATIAAVLLAIAGVLAAVVVARGGNSGLGWTIQLLSATALVVVMVVVAGGLDSTAHERGVDKSPQSPGHDDRHEGCQDKDVRD